MIRTGEKHNESDHDEHFNEEDDIFELTNA